MYKKFYKSNNYYSNYFLYTLIQHKLIQKTLFNLKNLINMMAILITQKQLIHKKVKNNQFVSIFAKVLINKISIVSYKIHLDNYI